MRSYNFIGCSGNHETLFRKESIKMANAAAKPGHGYPHDYWHGYGWNGYHRYGYNTELGDSIDYLSLSVYLFTITITIINLKNADSNR